MNAVPRLTRLALAGALLLAPSLAHAQLNTMSAQYFKVQNNGGNPDFQSGIDGGIVSGLVQNSLSGGLPVVTNFGATRSGGSGPITQTSQTGQLMWWTPNGSSILADVGPTPVGVPFTGMASNFFPSGETSNSNWFRTAIFTGMINLSNPATYQFSLGSDDDSWLFIDGILAGDNGGVKANNPTTFSTGNLSAGSHTVQIFFADRNTVQSGITFDPQFQISTVPEPSSLSLLATGLVGVVGAVRRRSKKLLA